MNYSGFPKHVTVAEKKVKAAQSLAKLKAKNTDAEPVHIEGRILAKSWWGKAWNLNLESYADYRNRIERGKAYVRNNSVLDLKITKGKIKAIVQGSKVRPYTVEILINPLDSKHWEQVISLCNHRIDSLEQLIEGKFPRELESLFTERKYGMFPSPDEIHFDCSCPDWAMMCKHVAAVLYGVGARLDSDPMLFFKLRDVDGHALIRKTIERKLEGLLKNAGKKSNRVIADEEIDELFGL